MEEDVVLFHDKDKVRVGGVFRYYVYLETEHIDRDLFLRVRNTELSALRAAYLNGPFTLYVDMIPMDYSEYVKTQDGAQPKYENHVKAGSHFSAQLRVNRPKQKWQITISSEILFSRSAEVNFEIVIGTTKQASKLHGSRANRHIGPDPLATEFKVSKADTAAIWQSPLPRPNEPLHVCVLTHGLVSNVTADMLYLKELLDKTADMSGENLICKGYTGNVCRTERGVKYLGRRVADWIADELIPTYKPAKLSFIAHSLGGLIQTFALGYLEATRPEVLKGIELANFIALASPFLGISYENPGYVQFALGFGVVGKTGRDLGLNWVPGTERPLLERLPGEHTLKILRRFRHRTVYANAVNDGIVPLRTSSILYLDWRAIGKSNAAEQEGKSTFRHPLHSQSQRDVNNMNTSNIAKEQKESQDSSGDDDSSLGSEGQLLGGNSATNSNNQKPAEATSSSSSSSSESHHKLLKPIKHDSFVESPLGALFSREERKEKTISRYQTVSNEDDLDSVGEKLPKKTSLIESGMSLLLPPHPDTEFISDPARRNDVIFHDRTYYQQDLPERKFKSKLSLKTGNKEKVDVARTEERIARQYHSGTSWRKVLVQLLPEAHNNIIVRRRFSNAYGWPVIHHVAREHFLFPAATDDEAEKIAQQVNQMQLDNDYSASNNENLWTESDDERDSQPDKDHDPQKAAMFKIIPQPDQH